ncbi:MAG: DUF4890 domain-containing protein [Chitinophagales bacterium]|nr:DUF4890 domain-containing protein [Bacteroidota bacterium]
MFNYLKISFFAASLFVVGLATNNVNAQESRGTDSRAVERPAHRGDMHRPDGEHERLTPEQRAEKMTQKMAEELNLSKEQYAKVLELNKQMGAKMEEQRARHEQDRERNKAEMMELRDAHDAKLKGILTPEQYEKFAAHRDDRMEHRKGMMDKKVMRKEKPSGRELRD